MSFLDSFGNDITSDWVTGLPPNTNTGFVQANGSDLGHVYSSCASNNCGVNEAPACSGFPSGYDDLWGGSFFHGTCTPIN